jgi:hypothetical protein
VDALVITDGTAEVYNLTVDEAHTYFVGDGEWLVHNSCPPNGDDYQPNIVYRNPSIRMNEHPGALKEGFHPKDPNATYTIEGHIINGSRVTFKSQYISTTKSLDIARQYRENPNIPIYAIDLNKVQGNVFDLTIESVLNENVKGIMSRNFARYSQEVIIEGVIPPEAIIMIIP